MNRLIEWVYRRRFISNFEASKDYMATINHLMFNDTEMNLCYQKHALYNMLSYAVTYVPFYRHIYNKLRISLSLKTITDDIKLFPILTKELIRKNFDLLISEKKIKGVYKNASGGSTGKPVILLQDSIYRQKQRDLTECFDAFSGYRLGDKRALIWGAEKDIISPSVHQSIKNFIIKRCFENTIILNSFAMNEEDMSRFVAHMNRFKPQYILAYTQSVEELAKFIESHQLSIYKPKSIIVSAGTLYDDTRNTIERVFNCKVFNRYGSRETGLMAMECECHCGLHENIFAQYIELLDDANIPLAVNDERNGHVIVTQLNNYIMPLIRYDIGDIAQRGAAQCLCGRGLPLLKSVRGRTVNIFKKRDGTRIDGEYFTHLFYYVNGVKRFQVIQHSYEDIEVIVAIDDSDAITHEVFNELTSKIQLVMGEKCQVRYSVVKDIKPTASGKYIYTISKVK